MVWQRVATPMLKVVGSKLVRYLPVFSHFYNFYFFLRIYLSVVRFVRALEILENF